MSAEADWLSPVQKVLELQARVAELETAIWDYINVPAHHTRTNLMVVINHPSVATDEGIPGSGQIGC